jgi:hypothetical protein
MGREVIKIPGIVKEGGMKGGSGFWALVRRLKFIVLPGFALQKGALAKASLFRIVLLRERSDRRI